MKQRLGGHRRTHRRISPLALPRGRIETFVTPSRTSTSAIISPLALPRGRIETLRAAADDYGFEKISPLALPRGRIEKSSGFQACGAFQRIPSLRGYSGEIDSWPSRDRHETENPSENEGRHGTDCSCLSRIVPVSGLAVAPWLSGQVAGRSQGQHPLATLDALQGILRQTAGKARGRCDCPVGSRRTAVIWFRRRPRATCESRPSVLEKPHGHSKPQNDPRRSCQTRP